MTKQSPADMKHARCAGSMWACEEHPNKPQDHDGCHGAGMPCDCNPCDEFNPPRADFDVAIEFPGSPRRRGAYRPTKTMRIDPSLMPARQPDHQTMRVDNMQSENTATETPETRPQRTVVQSEAHDV